MNNQGSHYQRETTGEQVIFPVPALQCDDSMPLLVRPVDQGFYIIDI